jgi:hypothetical protein
MVDKLESTIALGLSPNLTFLRGCSGASTVLETQKADFLCDKKKPHLHRNTAALSVTYAFCVLLGKLHRNTSALSATHALCVLLGNYIGTHLR